LISCWRPSLFVIFKDVPGPSAFNVI